ncbi:MAG: hypothetical protein KUL75_02335 [Sterolibacterium sp.]|nr:hypothetical protein [Sterolibacterium sp.]
MRARNPVSQEVGEQIKWGGVEAARGWTCGHAETARSIQKAGLMQMTGGWKYFATKFVHEQYCGSVNLRVDPVFLRVQCKPRDKRLRCIFAFFLARFGSFRPACRHE